MAKKNTGGGNNSSNKSANNSTSSDKLGYNSSIERSGAENTRGSGSGNRPSKKEKN